MDVRIPACCTNCGGLFPSRAVSITGGATVKSLQVIDSWERCPFCGGMAKVSSEVFSVANDVLSLFGGAALTPQLLEGVKRTVSSAMRDERPAEELVSELEPILPQLAAVLKRHAAQKGRYALLLAMVLTVISKCSVNVNLNMDVTLDINDVVRQLTGTDPSTLVEKKK